MMKLNKIKNIKFYKLLYYTFLFLYFGYYIIIISSNYGTNVSSTTIKFLRYFIYAGFILKILITTTSIKKTLEQLLLVVVTYMVYLITNDLKIFEILLIIYASKNMEFDSIARFLEKIIVMFCFVVILSAILGIIPNYQFFDTDVGRFRYSLGFTYVSQLPALLLESMFLNLYNSTKKNKKNINYLKIFFWGGLIFVVYRITIVRAMLICGVLLIILYLIYFYNDKFFSNNIIITKFFESIFIICAIFSVIVMISYNPQNMFFKKLNQLLSTRLELTEQIKQQYNIKIFGNNIKMNGGSSTKYSENTSDYIYIDNLYIQLLYRNGLSSFVIYLVLCTKLMKFSIEQKKYNLIAMWLFMAAVFSLIGDTIFSPIYNCTWILFWKMEKKNK